MKRQLYQLGPIEFGFPDPNFALKDPDGLLALGGDLSANRLKLAYQNGIFPWFSQNEPLLWWSPSTRAILELDKFHVSRSLKKYLRKHNFSISINCDFRSVITACQQQRIEQEGSWITQEMIHAYITLHEQGFAHSIEVNYDNKLVGGLYGVMQSGVFCGESMFHTMDNTSKLACWALVNWLKKHNASFIDCQLENPYLTALGAQLIPRAEFLTKLKKIEGYVIPKEMWKAQTLENIYDTDTPR